MKDISFYVSKKGNGYKTDYVSTENMLQNYQGIIRFTTKDEIKGTSFLINDILLSNIRPYLKKAWIADFNGYANQDVLVIRSTQVNPFFLYHIISSQLFVDYVMTGVKGIKMPRGDKKQIMNFELNIPNHIEQRYIADLLNKIDSIIDAQNKIIDLLEASIYSLRNTVFSNTKFSWVKLIELENDNLILLQRGNVIPKHAFNKEYKYPVYSSSVHNNGLMGFNNSFMFDEKLITWSIDGGGDFFYRDKHKFNVTNVCGIMKLNDNKFDYCFCKEALEYQHSKLVFNYQTKAHPSVIEKMYFLPVISLKEQKMISQIFLLFNKKLIKEKDLFELYKKQKASLLMNLFI